MFNLGDSKAATINMFKELKKTMMTMTHQIENAHRSRNYKN